MSINYRHQFSNQESNVTGKSNGEGLPPRNRDKSPIERMGSQGAGTPTPGQGGHLDSGDARAMVGKPVEEIKLIKMMRQKFQTTSIPRLEFEDYQGNITYFDDYYDYMKPLGCGSFGFVVAAIDKKTGDHVALKVSKSFSSFSHHLTITIFNQNH